MISLLRYEARTSNSRSLLPKLFNMQEWSRSLSARRYAIELNKKLEKFKQNLADWQSNGRMTYSIHSSQSGACAVYSFAGMNELYVFFHELDPAEQDLAPLYRHLQREYPSACFFFDKIIESDSPPVPDWTSVNSSDLNEKLTAFQFSTESDLIFTIRTERTVIQE